MADLLKKQLKKIRDLGPVNNSDCQKAIRFQEYIF